MVPISSFKWFSGSVTLVIGVAIGVGLSFAGSRFLPMAKAPEPAKTPVATPAKTGKPQSITVAQVQLARINRSLEATGTVGASELVPVFSQAANLQIVRLMADEGQFVKSGQVMAILDSSILQAQLAQAQGGVAQAEARLAELRAGTRTEELARAQEDVKSAQSRVIQAASDLELIKKRVNRTRLLENEGAVARDRLDEVLNQERLGQANVDQAQSNLRETQQQLTELQKGPRPEVISQAEANLAQAKSQVQVILAQLKNTRVLAPRSGLVAQRNVAVGDITSNSKQLFAIIENGSLELVLKIPETQMRQVQTGQAVQISSDPNPTLKLTGEVREIEPIIDNTNRQATVKVSLPGNVALKPGMFLRGKIIVSAATGLIAPAEAILPKTDGSAVAFVVQGDRTVQARSVEIGSVLPDGRVEIKNGLQAGDNVVVKGAPYLKNGDRVAIITEPLPTPSPSKANNPVTNN